jgi:hypothetical protein
MQFLAAEFLANVLRKGRKEVEMLQIKKVKLKKQKLLLVSWQQKVMHQKKGNCQLKVKEQMSQQHHQSLLHHHHHHHQSP